MWQAGDTERKERGRRNFCCIIGIVFDFLLSPSCGITVGQIRAFCCSESMCVCEVIARHANRARQGMAGRNVRLPVP